MVKTVIRYEKVEPEVGMRVKVVDPGRCYSQYVEWFKKHNIDIEHTARFRYGTNVGEYYTHKQLVEMSFEIVAVGVHGYTDDVLCLITTDDMLDGGCWLIGADGLECIDEENECDD